MEKKLQTVTGPNWILNIQLSDDTIATHCPDSLKQFAGWSVETDFEMLSNSDVRAALADDFAPNETVKLTSFHGDKAGKGNSDVWVVINSSDELDNTKLAILASHSTEAISLVNLPTTEGNSKS